jgi:hypothetical protein
MPGGFAPKTMNGKRLRPLALKGLVARIAVIRRRWLVSTTSQQLILKLATNGTMGRMALWSQLKWLQEATRRFGGRATKVMNGKLKLNAELLATLVAHFAQTIPS